MFFFIYKEKRVPMNIEMNEGFNVIYARKGGSPKNSFLKTRREVVEFLLEHINNIDFISINDKQLDKNELVNNNLKLSRYLKLI